MIYLDNQAIERLSDPLALMECLREAFQTAGDQPRRSHYDLRGGDRTLLVMPSWLDQRQIGIKLITVAPDRNDSGRGSVSGVFVMLDAESGGATALLDAAALTTLRTAGVAALAASLLAPPRAETMLMIGTGALAGPLVRAHASVRPLDRILIWGRDQERVERVVTAVSSYAKRVGFAGDLGEAISEADIICSATHSREPLVRGELVRRGAYVSLIGSYTPLMREADDTLFLRGRLIVDTCDAFSESGDLIGPAAAGLIEDRTTDLTTLLRGGMAPRSVGRDVTIFKSVGVGLADLAVAKMLLADPRVSHSLILPIEIG